MTKETIETERDQVLAELQNDEKQYAQLQQSVANLGNQIYIKRGAAAAFNRVLELLSAPEGTNPPNAP